MIMKVFFTALVASSFLLHGLGSVVSEKQQREEGNLISGVRSHFQFYQIKNDGSLPTNWTMLKEWFTPAGWGTREEQFRELFGEMKRFTNSIYEKYVFINPGVSIFLYEDSLILFMSAAPVPTAGGLYRYAVYYEGTNLISGSIKEERIQKAFAKANRTIPIPSPAPSAIDQAKVAAEKEFFRYSRESFAKFRKERPELFEGEVELPRESPPRRSQFRPPDKGSVTNEGKTIAAAEPAKSTWWLISPHFSPID